MTTLAPTQSKSNSRLSPTNTLFVYLVLASLATLYDAYSSWLIIEVNPIALEGNPLWSSIAATLGFGGAMIVRAGVGVLMIVALWRLGNQQRFPQARRYARFGLRAVTLVLLLLVAYHIFGTLYLS